jgi:hypothetical protein
MNLELAILNVLTGAERAIGVGRIRGFLPGFIGGEHTLSDVEIALHSLETKGHITGTFQEDRGTLWKETADGRLRLTNSR